MRILVFDNYDSFTYNLVHCIEKVSPHKVEVFRNNRISLAEIVVYDKILLSPGPGLPAEAGILKQVIETYAPSKSILGVCLGQQAIAEVFGARLRNLDKVYHGVASEVEVLQDDLLFRTIPSRFQAGRYHSWVVDTQGFPASLEVTVKDEQGLIMGLRHRTYDVRGVQFHPESVLTEFGETIIKNWIES
ncbi:MAG: anthranilate synthase component II [Bacteroidia bacterium]